MAIILNFFKNNSKTFPFSIYAPLSVLKPHKSTLFFAILIILAKVNSNPVDKYFKQA
jgi:hypothetical protein